MKKNIKNITNLSIIYLSKPKTEEVNIRIIMPINDVFRVNKAKVRTKSWFRMFADKLC